MHAPEERPARDAAFAFLAGLVVYWSALALHTGEAFPQSRWAYFAYYARALLDGHLYFTVQPPSAFDLAVYEGRLYLHFPPFPAVLLAPLVALFGVGLADRFVCVVLGAANGALFAELLRRLDARKLICQPRRSRLLLTVFFLFGTVHFYLAVTGNPWEFAHVACNALLLAACLLAVERHYALAALALVGVMFTRSHVVLVLPAFVGLYLWSESRAGAGRRELARGLVPSAAILGLGVVAWLGFNYLRFGELLETGVSYHRMHPMFRERFERYGYFHPAYLGRNLHALLLALPVRSARFPYFTFSPQGLSIFLASPLYVYALRSVRRETRATALWVWAAVALPLVPILLLMGTGEYQFGHRYSSDFQVLLILLTALGLRGRFDRTALILLGLSVAMNVYGTWWFVSSFAQ